MQDLVAVAVAVVSRRVVSAHRTIMDHDGPPARSPGPGRASVLGPGSADPGPSTDMAIIALLAMFAQMELIYMLERVGARAAKQARGLPTGRPVKLNATTRAGAAQRIGDGAIPEQAAADLGISRSTLYRELRKHREGAVAERVVREG